MPLKTVLQLFAFSPKCKLLGTEILSLYKHFWGSNRDQFNTKCYSSIMKFLVVFVALVTISVLFANMAAAEDCLSKTIGPPCFEFDPEACQRSCVTNEGRTGGHCSPSMECMCEGCWSCLIFSVLIFLNIFTWFLYVFLYSKTNKKYASRNNL